MTERGVHLEQVFFGWSEASQQQALLAASFPDDDGRRMWLRRLQNHIRLQSMPGAAVPDHAFSYFRFPDGSAALLRRADVGGTPGRNNSHALIGPADQLTFAVAVGLSYWPKWLTVAPGSSALPPFTAQSQAEMSNWAAKQLRPQTAAWTDVLVPVLARMTEDPRSPISVIGCPDDGRLPVIWALRDIATVGRLGAPELSFSTYEIRHDAGIESLPHIMFLPDRPLDSGVVERTIVDLTDPLSPDQSHHVAQRMVDDYIKGSLRPVAGVPSVTATSRPAGRSPVAMLLQAASVRDFDAELTELQRASSATRGPVRAALTGTTLDTLARHVEVVLRTELLGRLLEAAYGPRMDDLDDRDGHSHARRLIRDCDSDQLAMMVGAARPRDPVLAAAAMQRWVAGAGGRSSEPAALLVKRLRAAQVQRHLPLILAAAVLAVLTAVFLSGLLVGRSKPSPTVAAATPPATSTRPADSVPPGVGVATSTGVDPQKFVLFAFVKAPDGRTYTPQAPCTPQSEGLWLCLRRPDAAGTNPTVAFKVTQEEASRMAASVALESAAAWGPEIPVR